MMTLCARCWACLWVVLFLFVVVPHVRGQEVVITREELVQAGAVRLSDVFELLDNWAAASTEGYTWDVSAAALAPLRDPGWLLVVDGVPVNLRVLGRQNINTLPVALSEVDRIEVHETPAMIAGQFAPAGAIHVHTLRPQPHFSLRGDVSAGNETGDPGPFRYTEWVSPNIDRTGPVFQGSLAAATPFWYVRVQGKADEHHATDERIQERVRTLYRGVKAPRLILAAARADLGILRRRSTHTLYGSYAQLQDLLFFEPVGGEIPANHYFFNSGLTGNLTHRPLGAHYRIAAVSSLLATRANPADANVDWRQRGLSGSVEGYMKRESFQATVGLSGDYLRTSFTGRLYHVLLRIGRLYGQVEMRLGGMNVSAAGTLVQAEMQRTYSTRLQMYAKPGDATRFTFVASLSRQSPQESQSLWHWMGERYAPAGLAWELRPEISRTITGDISLYHMFSGRLQMMLSSGVRTFQTRTIPVFMIPADAPDTGFVTETGLHRYAHGRVIRIVSRLTMYPHSSVQLQIHYALQHPFSRDDYFIEAWQNQPRHRASATMRFAPNKRLSIFGRLRYMKAAASLPPYYLLDVTVQKRLWQEHLRFSATLRNILNQSYQAHPAGAITHMSLYFRLQFFLRT